MKSCAIEVNLLINRFLGDKRSMPLCVCITACVRFRYSAVGFECALTKPASEKAKQATAVRKRTLAVRRRTIFKAANRKAVDLQGFIELVSVVVNHQRTIN